MTVDRQILILLVEDAGTMRKMEARILNQLGFQNIVEAVDGEDAIEKLRSSGNVQLVISDWAMPKLDGYGLLQWMRAEEQFRGVPFIMATGHGDKAYVGQAMEAGANGVVAKPFTADDLQVKIDEAFGIVQEKAPVADEQPRVTSSGALRLRMAHIQITDHLPLGVLRHLIDTGKKQPKLFRLETQCLPGWNPVQKALEDGAVDGAFILAPAAMDLFGYGVPIRLILFAHRNGSIMVRTRAGNYQKPYQQFFKHKTFFIPHKMSVHNMLAHMYFTRMGLRPGVAGKEAVNVLFDVVPPIQMPAFLKDTPEACGFMVAEPIGSRAIAAGIAEPLLLSSEIWENHPCCVVVLRAEVIAKYPEAVQEFSTMLVEAGQFIEAEPDQSAEIAVTFLDPDKKLGLEASLLRKVLTEPMGIKTGDMYPVLEDLATMQEYMTTKMGIGQQIDLEKFIDIRFAQVACKTALQPKKAAAISELKRVAETAGRPEAGGIGTTVPVATLAGKYLIFRLGKEHYGLGIMDVREIIKLMPITHLPYLPTHADGVIDLRGKVIPVIDARAKFGMERVERNERTCIIVVEVSGLRGSRLMGMVVDEVSEVTTFKEEEISPPPAFGQGIDVTDILGMAKRAEALTILLDIDRILHTDDVVQLGNVM